MKDPAALAEPAREFDLSLMLLRYNAARNSIALFEAAPGLRKKNSHA